MVFALSPCFRCENYYTAFWTKECREEKSTWNWLVVVKGGSWQKEDTKSTRAQKYPQKFKLVRNLPHPHNSILPVGSTTQDPDSWAVRPGELPVSTTQLDMEWKREILNTQFQKYYELDRTLWKPNHCHIFLRTCIFEFGSNFRVLKPHGSGLILLLEKCMTFDNLFNFSFLCIR